MTIIATYPKPALLTIPSFVAYQRLQVWKAIKQSAQCKRPQSDISAALIFMASGKKITREFISILTPPRLYLSSHCNQVKAKFEKQKEIRDIKIEGKKLSDMSDKISSYAIRVYVKL
jgi:hypothetical protein